MVMASCVYTLILLIQLIVIPSSFQHGRLTNPPGRSTAWRFGFDTPTNQDDNELNCGGFARQWSQNGGKCGECGDPWDLNVTTGERPNQAGGTYANGTIVATYNQGQDISISLQITAQHKGWHEFRLCPVNNVSVTATWDCLNQYKLEFSDGSTRHYIPSTASTGNFTYTLRLPTGLSCSQCVLQWMWHCGNSWGQFPNGTACTGCGPQEQFYGCADITILSSSETGPPTSSTSTQSTDSTTATATTTTTAAATTTTTAAATTTTTVTGGNCVWIGQSGSGSDAWCNVNCNHVPPNCPADKCYCEEE